MGEMDHERGDATARRRERDRAAGPLRVDRPGTTREDAPEVDTSATSLAARAAAAGRTDVLGRAAVLRLQRAAGNAGTAAALEDERESPIADVIGKGGGAPLDGSLRGVMEHSFGTDFGDVRVHAGASASASARAVDAHAYTVGSEIVLGEGTSPGAPGFDRTLAHELTHVIQQRSGPVEGTPAGGGVSISNPSDRFEQAAEATADRVMAGGGAGRAAGGDPAGAGPVQRQPDPEPDPEDDQDLQALAIQRSPTPEDDESAD